MHNVEKWGRVVFSISVSIGGNWHLVVILEFHKNMGKKNIYNMLTCKPQTQWEKSQRLKPWNAFLEKNEILFEKFQKKYA